MQLGKFSSMNLELLQLLSLLDVRITCVSTCISAVVGHLPISSKALNILELEITQKSWTIQIADVVAGVMTDRARLSKLETYTKSSGADFLGSKDFPNALVASILKSDPRGVLFGTSHHHPNPKKLNPPRLREILDAKIKGKKLLVCSGGADKLVPYHCAEPFMQFLKNATSGWYEDGNVYVEDIVYPGVGHAYSEGMVKDTTRFFSDILAGSSLKPASKI
jgi:hypothetical protein